MTANDSKWTPEPRMPSQSAFIVAVPQAEPYVSELRDRFDATAKLGVPAHITVLFPFMSRDQIDESILDKARAALSGRMFRFRLTEVEHFPTATYLRPEPAAPLIQLTEALVQAFPTFLPYGGRHRGIVPHLTVAHGTYDRDRVSDVLRKTLPDGGIEQSCTDVLLIENSSGVWKKMFSFALNG